MQSGSVLGASPGTKTEPQHERSSTVTSGSESKFCHHILISVTSGQSDFISAFQAPDVHGGGKNGEDWVSQVGSRCPDLRRVTCSKVPNVLSWWFSKGKLCVEGIVVEDKEKIRGLLLIFNSFQCK